MFFTMAHISKGKIYLLRHAESEFNAGNTGLYDAPLTATGKAQAALVTGHFDVVLCSPLTRAKQTLELSEITYDKLEFHDIIREHKSDKCDFFPDEDIIFETEIQIIERANKLKELIKEVSEKVEKVLIVGHCDIFFYMTSKDVDGELFGNCLKNSELLEVTL